MKKFLIVLLAIVLVTAVFVPTASAWRRGGCFGCGFGFGVLTGAVVGSALAWPFYYPPYPYYYNAPYPYYGVPPTYYGVPPAYAVPQPYCYTQQGYWQQAPVSNGGGFTTYQSVWVPPQSVCR